jgi:hypothetical protein
MRAAAILAGVVLGLAGLVVSAIYLIFIGWGCEGTDAGDPPPDGSLGATLCDSPALSPALLALGLAALVAPLVGAAIAARRRRPAPLLGSAAVAAGAYPASDWCWSRYRARAPSSSSVFRCSCAVAWEWWPFARSAPSAGNRLQPCRFSMTLDPNVLEVGTAIGCRPRTGRRACI